MNKDRGFSLIELLIVVAIILIIAAIAIPTLLRAKIAANEASGVGSVRTITTAETTYASSWGTGYATNLGFLGGTPAACAAPNWGADGEPSTGVARSLGQPRGADALAHAIVPADRWRPPMRNAPATCSRSYD